MSDELLIGRAKLLTLTDADISSQRRVTRRSLLGTLGIGAGVGAAAVFGGTTSVAARGDPPGRGTRCTTDTDTSPRDPAGRGRGNCSDGDF
jgi:hypothetical protein